MPVRRWKAKPLTDKIQREYDMTKGKNKGSSINYSDCLDLSAKIVYFNYY